MTDRQNTKQGLPRNRQLSIRARFTFRLFMQRIVNCYVIGVPVITTWVIRRQDYEERHGLLLSACSSHVVLHALPTSMSTSTPNHAVKLLE